MTRVAIQAWVFLAIAIVTEVFGTLSLRATVDHPGWIPAVVVAYTLSFVTMGLALRYQMPVGVAYSIWSAVGVAAIAVLGVFLFQEHLGWPQILGIAAVIVGVVLIESGTRSPSPPPVLDSGDAT